MTGVDPLNLAPFFAPADTLTRKKNKERNSVHAPKTFSQLLNAGSEEQLQEAQQAFVPETSVQKAAGSSFDKRLTELVDAVYASGDALKKNPFTDTFISYKQSLSRFIRFVVDNSYELEAHIRRKGTKRQQLVIVQTINAKLEELAADILYNQADQLRILAKVEEINGIVVDFLS